MSEWGTAEAIVVLDENGNDVFINPRAHANPSRPSVAELPRVPASSAPDDLLQTVQRTRDRYKRLHTGPVSHGVPLVVTADACECIKELDYGGGLEVVAALYGGLASERGRSRFCVRGVQPLKAESHPGWVRIYASPEELRGHPWTELFGWQLIGVLHSHESLGPTGPSRTDLEHLQAWADDVRRDFCGLIISASGESYGGGLDWSYPFVQGWVAQPGSSSLSPLELIVEGRGFTES
jgi:hypothetical protein